jgi:hypothetical protein
MIATSSAGTSRADVAVVVIVGLLIIAWLVVSYFVGRAAEKKNRSFASFFLIALLVSPILGAIIVAALPPSGEALIAKGQRLRCPHCAEAVNRRARICPHCRSAIA